MAITTDNPQLNEFIEEAKVNYQSSRFADAAGTYDHLSQTFRKNNADINSLYFVYAKIASWAKAQDKEQTLRSLMQLLRQTAETVRKLSMEYTSKIDDIHTQNVYMEIALDAMKHVDNRDVAGQYAQSLLNNYIHLITEEKKDFTLEHQEAFIQRIIELKQYLHGSKNDIRKWKLHKAEIIELLCDFKLQSKQFQVKETAAAILVRVIQIYIELRDKDRLKASLTKFFKIDSKLQLSRYDIPIADPTGIDTFIAGLANGSNGSNVSNVSDVSGGSQNEENVGQKPGSSQTTRQRVVVDLSNVAWDNRRSDQGPTVRNILIMERALTERNIDYVMIASAALYHQIDKKEQYRQLMIDFNIVEAPAGDDDDEYIIKYALAKNLPIISRDRYREYVEANEAIGQRIAELRTGYTIVDKDGSVILGKNIDNLEIQAPVESVDSVGNTGNTGNTENTDNKS